MSRGNWSIVLALVGWLTLAGASASPPNEGAPTNQAEANQSETAPQNAAAAAQPEYAPYPNRYAERCYQAQDHDAADLCAQWRAAYAAEKAAKAARAGNWIAGAGALLSFISVVLVLMALAQGREANSLTREEGTRNTARAAASAADTKRALEIAEKNADAAYAQAGITEQAVIQARRSADAASGHLEVAQDTAKRQLRAYVGFWKVGLQHIRLPDQNDTGFAFRVRWKNTGATPARNCKVWMYMRAFPNEDDAKRFVFEFEPIGPEISGIIAPGAIMDGPTATMVAGHIRSGSTIIAARVEYSDVFSDEVHESEVRMIVTSHSTVEGGLTFVYRHASVAKAT